MSDCGARWRLQFSSDRIAPTMPKFNPDVPVPDTNFTDKNAVDRYLECGRFRRCANLKAAPAYLPDVTIYIPMCMKSRFNRTDVAAYIPMPSPNQPLNPLTQASLRYWSRSISCPRNCREYKNATVARIWAQTRRFSDSILGHVIKPSEIWWAAFWAWVMGK